MRRRPPCLLGRAPRAASRARRRAETGAVTAEAAVVMPTMILLVVALAWVVSLGVTQVRVVDAARETARAAARSETSAQAVALGRRVAPTGSRITVTRAADDVVVRVVAPVRGPGGLLAHLPTVEVSSRAVAAAEPTS